MTFKDLVKEYISISEGNDITNNSDGFKGKKLRPAGAPHPVGNPKKKDISNGSDAFAGKGKGTSGPNYNVNNSTLGNAGKNKNIDNSSNGFGSAKNESVELDESSEGEEQCPSCGQYAFDGEHCSECDYTTQEHWNKEESKKKMSKDTEKKEHKKHEKKETKKEEKKEHKPAKKDTPKHHSSEQSYKGQYPEGEDYNSQFTGKPKTSGSNGKLIVDKALASCSTEVKKVKSIRESSREILDAWKKKAYKNQEEPAAHTFKGAIKEKGPAGIVTNQKHERNKNRELEVTKEGKKVFGKNLPTKADDESTPPNQKIMGDKDLSVVERRKAKK
jgi:hypothetical protein